RAAGMGSYRNRRRPDDPVGQSRRDGMTSTDITASSSAPPSAGIDPITAAVIGGGLRSIAVEMGYRLARMAYSSIIRESEDFGCALCDAQGRQLCEATQS